MVLPRLRADDPDEAEDTARYAIDIARQLVKLSADTRDTEALAALRELLDLEGPQASHSQATWHKVIRWLNEVPATHSRTAPQLDL